MKTENNEAAATERVPASAWYALAVLTAVYLLNFLNRTLIYILFTPIKAEMKFTDFQLAVLGRLRSSSSTRCSASRSGVWPTACRARR